MSKDYYQILGLHKGASEADIKSAFRRLAREHHPDKGGSAEKFKEINEAYQVLGDATKKQQYDQYGTTFDQAGGGGGDPFGGFGGFGGQGVHINMEDLGDVFGDFFGSAFGGGFSQTRSRGRAKGADIQMEIKIDFRDAIFGVEREIELYKTARCPDCNGSGGEGGKMEHCAQCGGRGEIRERRKTLFGVMQTASVCPSCGGMGEEPAVKCKTCTGLGVKKELKRLRVNIPAGTEDGDILRLRAEGEAASRGTAGDLYLKMNVKADPEFRRKGNDIVSKISISFPEAALGANVQVKTLDGPRDLKIPAGLQSGEVLSLRNLGVPHERGRGDQLVEVIVRTPTKLNKKQRDLLEQLRKDL